MGEKCVKGIAINPNCTLFFKIVTYTIFAEVGRESLFIWRVNIMNIGMGRVVEFHMVSGEILQIFTLMNIGSGPKKVHTCFAWLCQIKPEKHKFDKISKLLTLIPFQNGA